MNKKKIAILDLYLDSKNPRHDLINDQSEIVNYHLASDKVKNLAKDISENGLNPLDTMAVLEDDGKYIVLEGNRRTCALILLNDPDRAPKNHQSFFKSLSVSNKVPSLVEYGVYKNRKDADLWIERRHDGEQDGKGLVRWNATQKARHFGGSPNTLADTLLDYALNNDLITFNQKNELTKVGVTTLTRTLSTPRVREVIGITSGTKDSKIKLNVSLDDFNRALDSFLKEALKKDTVINSRNNLEQRTKYANELLSDGIATTEKVSQYELGKALDNNNRKNSKNKNENKKGNARDNQSPDKRKTLISSNFRVKIDDNHLRRMRDELKKISCNDFPLATAMTCRVFLENIYISYYEKYINENIGKMKVNNILGRIIKSITTDDLNKEEKKAFQGIKKVCSNEHNVLSALSLGAFAHGALYPDHKQLKIEWDNIQAFVLYMLKWLNE